MLTEAEISRLSTFPKGLYWKKGFWPYRAAMFSALYSYVRQFGKGSWARLRKRVEQNFWQKVEFVLKMPEAQARRSPHSQIARVGFVLKGIHCYQGVACDIRWACPFCHVRFGLYEVFCRIEVLFGFMTGCNGRLAKTHKLVGAISDAIFFPDLADMTIQEWIKFKLKWIRNEEFPPCAHQVIEFVPTPVLPPEKSDYPYVEDPCFVDAATSEKIAFRIRVLMLVERDTVIRPSYVFPRVKTIWSPLYPAKPDTVASRLGNFFHYPYNRTSPTQFEKLITPAYRARLFSRSGFFRGDKAAVRAKRVIRVKVATRKGAIGGQESSEQEKPVSKMRHLAKHLAKRRPYSRDRG